MSIDEIVDQIDAYSQNKKNDLKMQIIMAEVQAQQIAERVMASEDSKPTRLWEFYPSLFDEERKIIENQEQDEELEKIKALRKKFIEVHNSRLGGDDE